MNINDHLIDCASQSKHYFMEGFESIYLNIDDEAIATKTTLPMDALNTFFLVKEPQNFRVLLHKGKEFYHGTRTPFSVLIPKKWHSDSIQESLDQIDYISNEILVTMGLKLSAIIGPTLGSQLSIKATDTKLIDWMLPLMGAFESSYELIKTYTDAHQNALNHGFKFHHFTLYQQAQPVSSLTLSINNRLARIDDVGTDPNFQGKGYAKQLMIYALNNAYEHGATYCFLDASAQGLGLYEKLGFESLEEHFYYTMRS